ncbi:MAG: esterase [Crocinitomicaceae bacterium]|nr:esterase [Crocinitomicaceae bacterium]
MKIIVFVLALFCSCNTFLHAQETLYITSKHISSTLPVLVQLPSDYAPQKHYPLVIMLHGYSENYQQWSNTTNLQQLANSYQMILVCPEGYVSYYLNSPQLKHQQYERFFFDELVPFLERHYSIDAKNRFITGLSMGGYGALSLFIQHSSFFNTAAASSGALEFDYENYRNISLSFFGSERMTNDLKENLGNPVTNNWQQYSISTLLAQQPNFNKGFFLDCGLQDPLLSNTLRVKKQAISKGLPIRFAFQPGEHNSAYWAKAVEYHFVYFKQHLRE